MPNHSHPGTSPLYPLIADLAHYSGCPSLLENLGCWEIVIAGKIFVAVNASDASAYNSLKDSVKPFEIKVYLDNRFCARFSIAGDDSKLTGELTEAEIFACLKIEIRRYNLACFV